MNAVSPAVATAIVLDADDDVATALVALAPGARVTLLGAAQAELTAAGTVPRCHKVAVRAVAAGAPVRKYGAVIGLAVAPIAVGEHVHEHNLRSRKAQRAADPVRG